MMLDDEYYKKLNESNQRFYETINEIRIRMGMAPVEVPFWGPKESNSEMSPEASVISKDDIAEFNKSDRVENPLKNSVGQQVESEPDEMVRHLHVQSQLSNLKFPSYVIKEEPVNSQPAILQAKEFKSDPTLTPIQEDSLLGNHSNWCIYKKLNDIRIQIGVSPFCYGCDFDKDLGHYEGCIRRNLYNGYPIDGRLSEIATPSQVGEVTDPKSPPFEAPMVDFSSVDVSEKTTRQTQQIQETDFSNYSLSSLGEKLGHLDHGVTVTWSEGSETHPKDSKGFSPFEGPTWRSNTIGISNDIPSTDSSQAQLQVMSNSDLEALHFVVKFEEVDKIVVDHVNPTAIGLSDTEISSTKNLGIFDAHSLFDKMPNRSSFGFDPGKSTWGFETPVSYLRNSSAHHMFDEMPDQFGCQSNWVFDPGGGFDPVGCTTYVLLQFATEMVVNACSDWCLNSC